MPVLGPRGFIALILWAQRLLRDRYWNRAQGKAESRYTYHSTCVRSNSMDTSAICAPDGIKRQRGMPSRPQASQDAISFKACGSFHPEGWFLQGSVTAGS